MLNTFKRGIYTIFTITIVLLGCSCETNYYTDVSEILKDVSDINENAIVINGTITSEKKLHKVLLTKPQRLTSTKTDSITGAKIDLVIGKDTFEYIESIYHPGLLSTEKYPGTYISADSICGRPGCLHKLIVEYSGEVLTASDSMVHATSIEIEELELEYIEDPFTASLPLYANKVFFGTSKHHFGYQFPVKYNLITKDTLPIGTLISNVYCHNHIEPQGMLSDWSVYNEIFPGIDDSIWIEKYSLSYEYEEYLIAVYKETEWKTGYFSATSANVPTNISNGGMGYFSASDVSTLRISAFDLKNMLIGSN